MKQEILEVYNSKAFQIAIDVCRIAMVGLLIAILFVLITNIQAVKVLSYDVCKICEQKTNATCIITINPQGEIMPSYELNKSLFGS